MDSITEEELLQMVRDFIESESASPISAPSSKALSHNDQLPYLALQVCVCRSPTTSNPYLSKELIHVFSSFLILFALLV
jgi:hypothetical protein